MNYEIARETLRPQSSARIPRAAISPQFFPDKHQSISRSNRCRCPWSKQTVSRSLRLPTSHAPLAPRSPNSKRPAGGRQSADPALATCTIRPDDRPGTSYQSAGAGTEPDAPDRSPNYPTLRLRTQAPQTKAFRSRENTTRVSSPLAAATRRIAPICRSRFETVPPPSPAASLCLSANTQTTAPQFSDENKALCRCQTESPPANRRAHAPSRHDSTAPRPNSSSDRDRSSPAAHTLSSDRKNLPGPTSRPHSSSPPSAFSSNTSSPALSRTHRSSDAPRNRSRSAAYREYILRSRSKAAPAADTNRKYRSDQTQI